MPVYQGFPRQVIPAPVLASFDNHLLHDECDEPSCRSVTEGHVQAAEEQAVKHVQTQLLTEEDGGGKAVVEVVLQQCCGGCCGWGHAEEQLPV